VTAAGRFIATSQPRTVSFIRFPTVGVIILITACWLFIGIWSLAQQPYYRSRWGVGSPPLAIRTGMFALGFHEKLQVRLVPYLEDIAEDCKLIDLVGSKRERSFINGSHISSVRDS
jgi:hypothetical protein